MIRRYGIALTVFGVWIAMSVGSAQAISMGHFSSVPIGPALERGPLGEQGGKIDSPAETKGAEGTYEKQVREPVMTGNLPESAESRSDSAAPMENAEKLDRQDVDTGP